MADDKTTPAPKAADGGAPDGGDAPAKKAAAKKPAAKKPAPKAADGGAPDGGDLVLTGKGSVLAGGTRYAKGDRVAAGVVAGLPKRQRAFFTAADGDA